MRGERSVQAANAGSSVGSSPRARGTGTVPAQSGQASRFIPACAGNGSGRTGDSAPCAVHPRVRGERQDPTRPSRPPSGSSPRARGTAQASGCNDLLGRFIPACAGNGAAASTPSASPTVHPRVRGERALPDHPGGRMSGSSPRARGTDPGTLPQHEPVRFIPACAGNGTPLLAHLVQTPVHPRVRGERTLDLDNPVAQLGSSPRARGTAVPRPSPAAPGRFIPACAGNGPASVSPGRAPPVHPRVRGERLGAMVMSEPNFGSSPRARGTVAGGLGLVEPQRFIPACAGNGEAKKATTASQAVHPRVRGERRNTTSCSYCLTGSSPRARGTAPCSSWRCIGPRFIPACAGNGPDPTKPQPGQSVHPRVRGERVVGLDVFDGGSGSSPRARGTGMGGLVRDRPRRFIPACAGNGRVVVRSGMGAPVHPRVRGEREIGGASAGSDIGSSPRARGTADPLVVLGLDCRFIPACAGNGSQP